MFFILNARLMILPNTARFTGMGEMMCCNMEVLLKIKGESYVPKYKDVI